MFLKVHKYKVGRNWMCGSGFKKLLKQKKQQLLSWCRKIAFWWAFVGLRLTISFITTLSIAYFVNARIVLFIKCLLIMTNPQYHFSAQVDRFYYLIRYYLTIICNERQMNWLIISALQMFFVIKLGKFRFNLILENK